MRAQLVNRGCSWWWLASLGSWGASSGVENGGFCMLSGTLPAPGARNANFMLIPASPGVLLRRPPRFFRESEDFSIGPWGFEAAAAAFSAILIGLIRQSGPAGSGPAPPRALPARGKNKKSQLLITGNPGSAPSRHPRPDRPGPDRTGRAGQDRALAGWLAGWLGGRPKM